MIDFGTFDLAAQAASGYPYHVRDPLGVPMEYDGQPSIITLAGSDSAIYKNGQRDLARNNTDTSLDRDALAIEMLVICTLGWRGIIWNGEPLGFTSENARMLYSKHEWLREDCAGVILDRANFLAVAPAD